MDKGSEKAQHLLEESEYGTRHAEGAWRFLIPIVAASWSVFQLLLPKILLINSQIARSIHLGFAMLLVYLSFPLLKSAPAGLKFLSSRRLGIGSVIMAALASAMALYLAYDYIGIGARSGLPNTTDLVVGSLLLIFLLDAARRALGPALPTIASLFIIYSFVSEWMPSIVSFKNATFGTMISKLVMSTEGVYGVPLDVSTSTVFLFVLFGALLEKSGGGQYFIQLAFSLLGKYRGGPAKAAVLASGLTGMVSGSSIANTVTTGTFTIPLMKKAGFPGVKAAAVEVASSTNGQLMPPIMGAAAFIISEYCNLSYLAVVKAALVPALVSYLALIYITHLEAKKLNLRPVPPNELPKFWPTFLSGVHFLIPLGFLFVQMVVFRYSAALSVYYAILCLMALIIARELVVGSRTGRQALESIKISMQHIGESLVAGAKNMMSIGVAVAAAGIIVGVVTLGLGGAVIDLIDLISGGQLILMLMVTAVVSLILGMGLPTTANYIVMASLTAPAIVALSGDMGLATPLIAAHLFCFYFGILADDTPPVGLAAYAAGAIARENPIQVGIQGFRYDMRTAILPFMFIFNTELLLIGVDSIFGMLKVFLIALAAMFAFASCVQGTFWRACRVWERVLLGGVTLILFRPDLLNNLQGLGVGVWQTLGLALYAGLYFYQRMERQPAAAG